MAHAPMARAPAARAFTGRPVVTARPSIRPRAVGPTDAALDVGREWVQGMLRRFSPVNGEASGRVATLEFEKPLVELDKRIEQVGWGRATPPPRPRGGPIARAARPRMA